MANTGAIRAGKAYVELFADSSKLIRGLRAAEKQLAAFGASIQKIGLGMAGIGTAITMPLLKVAQFAGSMGDKLSDMSKRTGVSVESLSALQYVGSQTGVELDTLQKSLLIMHKNLYAAAGGSKSAKESLGALGLTVADLKGLAPEEQFAKIADAIGAVKNPSQKAALAMKVFGKSGAQLLPMFAEGSRGIQAMIDEAKSLGLVMSTEDANAASNFDDALNKLWATIKMAFFRIGSVLIPVLKKFVDTAAVVISKIAEWISQNKGVVLSIMWFGAALTTGGIAIAAFGVALKVLSKVMGIITTVFGAIRTAVLWMLSPFGAIVTLLTAGAGAFLYFSGYGAKALSWLGERFAALKADAIKSFQGISAALAKGDIGLAARIAWLFVKMEFLKAKQVLLEIWLSLKGKILEYWYGLGYAMVLAWDTAVYGLKVAWIETVAFLKKVWAGFKQWWGDTVDWVAKKMVKAYIWWQSVMDPNFDTKTAQQIADQSFEQDALSRAQETVAADDAAESQRQSSRDSARKAYDENLNSIGQAYGEDMLKIDQEVADRLKKNADEIAKTRDEWLKSIEEANKPGEKGPEKKPPALPNLNDVASQAGAAIGTFSSFGLSQLGTGGVVQRIALATERTAKACEDMADNQDSGMEFD